MGAFTQPTQRNSTLLFANLFRLVESVANYVANSVHTADATQLDSCVASAACIGLKSSSLSAV